MVMKFLIDFLLLSFTFSSFKLRFFSGMEQTQVTQSRRSRTSENIDTTVTDNIPTAPDPYDIQNVDQEFFETPRSSRSLESGPNNPSFSSLRHLQNVETTGARFVMPSVINGPSATPINGNGGRRVRFSSEYT